MAQDLEAANQNVQQPAQTQQGQTQQGQTEQGQTEGLAQDQLLDAEQDAATLQASGEAVVRRIISPLARLNMAAPQVVYEQLVALKWSGQLAEIVADPTPEDRAALCQILRRFQGDMGPYRHRLRLTLTLIFRHSPESDVEILQLTLGARFGIANVGNSGAVAQLGGTVDVFAARDLRRIWRVLEQLPDSHVEDLPTFDQLVATSQSGVGGVYLGRRLLSQLNTPQVMNSLSPAYEEAQGSVLVSMSVEDYASYYEELRKASRNPNLTPEERQELEQELDWGRRGLFDQMVRHEVGHAVDELMSASATYCPTPQGGGWRTHFVDEAGLIDELITAVGLDADCSAEQLEQLRQYLKSWACGPATPSS
jgi:hypothetical protein